jgi:hypothetical protein
MTDEDIVITSFRLSRASSVLSLAGSAEFPTHPIPKLAPGHPETFGERLSKAQLVSFVLIGKLEKQSGIRHHESGIY